MNLISDDLSVPVDMSPNCPEWNPGRSTDTLAGGDDFDCNAHPGVADVCILDRDQGPQRPVLLVERRVSASLPAGMVSQVRSKFGGAEVRHHLRTNRRANPGKVLPASSRQSSR
jgi:hypothetical protein